MGLADSAVRRCVTDRADHKPAQADVVKVRFSSRSRQVLFLTRLEDVGPVDGLPGDSLSVRSAELPAHVCLDSIREIVFLFAHSMNDENSEVFGHVLLPFQRQLVRQCSRFFAFVPGSR